MTRHGLGLAALVFVLAPFGCEKADDVPLEDAGQEPATADDAGTLGSSRDAGKSDGTGTVTPGPGTSRDSGARDAGAKDAGTMGAKDAGKSDTGGKSDGGATEPRDAGEPDDTTPDSAVTPSGALWKPTAGTTWQWDLSGTITKLDVAADVYDIDGFENDADIIKKLHDAGKKVICYISVGTQEPGRDDAKDFPKEGLGKYWAEWGETYIDIRNEGIRAIMAKRLDMCRDKGFDGVEPDNMDMFEGGMNDTGFPLTEKDGVDYAKWLATETHKRGMSIGQKNASSITSEIESLYDWAITEDCFADGWCDDMKSYTAHNKAMFMCEYTDTKVDFAAACKAGEANKFSPILKGRDLDSTVQFCK